jgi:translation initiation factor 2 gamma subunit (eIF-2gamma)
VKEGCDYFKFEMNVPTASHAGGVWERQIRSVRRVLATLMDQAGTQLDDESLRTLMCEAAAIVNSRPLTVANLNEPTAPEPLTPNHLLTIGIAGGRKSSKHFSQGRSGLVRVPT